MRVRRWNVAVMLAALVILAGTLIQQSGAQQGSVKAQTAAGDVAVDIVIRGGTVYDGTGGEPRVVDVGIRGDRIVAVGNLEHARAGLVVDAKGLAVAPGFINMLSHSCLLYTSPSPRDS